MEENIRERISGELNRIEKEENVKILLAVESGSRAWGFESKDSDYDVRFIYIRPTEWYLSIYEQRDVLEYPIDDILDISGWDLKKALNLLKKSNPPLLEWLKSHIIYKENYSIIQSIRDKKEEVISNKPLMYHYLHMAKGNFREYLQGENVRIKKYFYVLRPVLACMWIEKYNEVPPLEFDVLKKLIVDAKLGDEIEKLLKRKKSGVEFNMEPKIEELNNFLEDKIKYFSEYVDSIKNINKEFDLNKVFIEALKEVWGDTI